MKIVVFCGSKAGQDQIYGIEAYELGRDIVRRGHELVYWWGSRGLMGRVAEWALSLGGKVYGYFPRFLENREKAFPKEVEMVFLDTMDQRKVQMFQGSDAAIIIPGGFWTMDEFFEVLTLRQLGQYDKPIGILNVSWFYTPLMNFLHKMVEEGFVEVEHLDLFYMRESRGDLLESMGL
jgi:uncharacterized protein (TIGR00730 family)